MNSTIFLRLVWKEYRGLRAFWVAVVVATALIQGSMMLFTTNRPQAEASVVYAAIIAGIVLLIGSSAVVFSREREERTVEFLACLPTSSWQVVLAKLLWTVGGGVAAWAVLMVSALALGGDPARLSQIGAAPPQFVMPAAALNFLAWGLVFSLSSRQPLLAALLTIFVGIFAPLAVEAVLASLLPGDLDAIFRRGPYGYAVASFVSAVALVPLNVWLAARWLRGEGNAWQAAVPWARGEARQNLSTALARRSAMLGRLLWHSARQSRGWWLFVAAAWLFTIWLALAVYAWWPLAAVVGLILATYVGHMAFHPDQSRRNFRFFAEQNIGPRQVWLARQFASLPVAVVPMLGVALAIGARLLSDRATRSWFRSRELEYMTAWTHVSLDSLAEVLAVAATLAAVAYACGQWWGLFVRNVAVSATLAGVMAAGGVAWAFKMADLGINWTWAVLPVPAALLVSTWLRAPDWILERGGWRRTLLPVAVAVAPMVAIAIGVPVDRVASVEPIELDIDLAPYETIASPAALETAAMYQRAWERIDRQPSPRVIDDNPLTEGYPLDGEGSRNYGKFFVWDFVSSAMREWDFKVNRESIALFTAASERAECALREAGVEATRVGSGLTELILVAARDAEGRNELDEAWRHYRGLLRMANHLRQRSAMPWSGDLVERETLKRLVGWAGHEGQTAERVRSAMAEIRGILADTPPVAASLLFEYVAVTRDIAGDNARPGRQIVSFGTANAVAAARNSVALRFMPWERTRSQRVLDQLTRANLNTLETARQTIAQDTPYEVAVLWPRHYDARWAWEDGTWSARHPFATGRLGHGLGSPPILVSDDPPRPLYRPAHGLSALDIGSTWFISMELPFAGRDAGAQLVEREQTRRMVETAMAVEAWRAEHGQMPESLKQVLGDHFPTIPRDPYTGLPIQYVRGDREIDLSTPAEGVEMRWRNLPPMGRTLLWAAGPDVRASRFIDGRFGDSYQLFDLQFNYTDARWRNPRSSSAVFEHGRRLELPE